MEIKRILHKLMGLILMLMLTQQLSAQTYAVRYVAADNGRFENDGSSWAQAKNNLQVAIDELRSLIASGDADKGFVYVKGAATAAGMSYVPSSRSTEDADGSMFNTSFCIYGGIHVYGGFAGNEDSSTPGFTSEDELWKLRIMDNVAILGDAVDKTYAEVEDDIDKDNIGQTVRRWNFKYKTVLTGNHSATPYTFTFDSYRGIYSTTFPLNSYHVVWFGTNGKITPDPAGDEKELTGHFRGLSRPATLDGCTIEGGYASSTNLTVHEHTGFGGGVYMVKNALLRNCIVHHCAAMQRGGGVYMDGGGKVERCYIHTSQATGYGMQQGYGGGVCIDYDGSLEHSYVIQCAARIGAGLAICHVPDEYPEVTAYPAVGDRSTPYSPFAVSTVFSNNTSNAEGAGVYLDEGGTLNHCSVVNNKCIGPNVIYNGRRHGRTGGIYVRNGGTIYNSVAWGNECAANNDVQFAAYKTGEKKIYAFHSAFSKADITDWAAVTKEDVYTLNDQNFPSPEYNSGYFPMFKQPTINAGVQYASGGVVDPTANGDGEAYQRVYNWHPLAVTDLRNKAVQMTDAIQDVSEELEHAHSDIDAVGRKFESVSSCGALAHSYRKTHYVLLPSLEYSEGRVPSETGNIPTLFVDPTLITAGGINDSEHTGFLDDQPMGDNWTHPLNNLPDAIYYFKQRLVDRKNRDVDDPSLTYYRLERLDEDGNVVKDGSGNTVYDNYSHVQILVKEGKVSIAGMGSYVQNSARTASLRPGSNMRLYGGYPSTNVNQETAYRSPFDFNSDLSANVLNSDFKNHSVHVVAIANQHDVIVDGFRLYAGNANAAPAPDPMDPPAQWAMYHSLADGAGIVVNNAMSAADKRRDMTGNILRNCVIANCAAPEGAAAFVSGGYRHGTEDRECKAELTIVNTIVRNCTAGDLFDEEGNYHSDMFVAKPNETPAEMKITLQGIITANGNGKVWVRNCDVVNNCGFPFKCDESGDNTGHIEVYNTVVFSNGLRIHSDRSNISNTVYCPRESWGHVTGQYIYMGYDVLFSDEIVSTLEANHIYRVLTHNKSEDKTTKHWRLDDGSQQGVWGDTPETEVVVKYPSFVNPSRNVGHSDGDDISYYGGRVNYEPMPTNPIVNAANPVITTGTGILADNDASTVGYDFSLKGRDYGGDPDIGSIETHRLPVGGSVLYVTPEGAGRRDGSSWANAIQGNAIYALNGSAAAGSDELDTANGTTRLINTTGDGTATTGAADGVLTTDNRYCGGFARSWFKERRTGAVTTTTVTDTWTIEKNVYEDGGRMGEEEIIRNDVTPTRSSNTVINSAGTPEGGFSSGWADDERFPYGELSGQSRAFWRATGNYTPIPEWWSTNSFKSTDTKTDSYTGETVTGIGGGTFAEIIEDPTRGIKIRNNREENYVGGLQYAVEKAAAYNALAPGDPGRIAGIDSVQVWISNGTYTDYKGFVIRDNTTVLGSFPAKDGGTPGLTERQALMSAVVDIPKSKTAQDLNAEDYETILQISDVDPKLDDEHINLDAVKFWDDDYAKLSSTETTTYAYKTRTITHHLTHYDTGVQIDKTNDYVQYSDMTTDGSTNVWASRTTTDVGDTRYYTFGTATDTKDCWHISVPKANVGKRIGNCNGSGGDIYENGKKVGSAGPRGWIRDGSLTGVNIWQTLKNVPVGVYRISFDLAAFYYDTYKNVNGNAGNSNVNVTLQILDASDNVLASTPISYYYSGRGNMNRYSLYFNQASAGNVTVKLVVGPGLDRDGNEVADDFSLAVAANPNRREINMDNLKLYMMAEGEGYSEVPELLTDVTEDRVVADPLPDEVSSGTAYTVTKHRSTLRKRVLQMADKSNPVYCGGGFFGDPTRQAGAKITDNADSPGHSERVNDSRRKANNNQYLKYDDPDYEWYTDATWDGFTIRHGFVHDFAMTHGGGAGVSMYEGGHLKNCIIINNIVAGERNKGGGVFVDGSTSTVEGCFILNNSSTYSSVTGYSPSPVEGQIFAGGMFMYEGTCYNTLIANNYSWGNGGGLGLCVGRFYNNTVAYNTCRLAEGGGGLRIATGADSYILMANSILYGNSGKAISMTSTSSFAPFLNCFIQSTTAISDDKILKSIMAPNSSTVPEEQDAKISGGKGWRNQLRNGVAPSITTTPFEADVSAGVYTGNALTLNDYRLREDFTYCINKGTEDFAGSMHDALRRSGTSEGAIATTPAYIFASTVELPETDVAFADRVQDCQVDMGAYEFDGTRAIEPELFPNESPKKAVFFVTQTGAGMATAENPVNAACYLKFQKVLDAAGRWRYASYKYADDEDETQAQNNFTPEVFRKELVAAGLAANVNDAAITAELPNLKDYEVIVRLEGENGSGFSYIPTRSTNLISDENVNELEKSLIVPHGITIEGGYESDFSKERDILGRPTRFSGEVANETLGTLGNVYHVVTFTNTLFDVDEKPFKNESKDDLTDQLAFLGELPADYESLSDEGKADAKATVESNRVVLDGLFIQDGKANGTSTEHKLGGAAVVTNYAHIRNCVILENQASTYGGGLYLEPQALVSGCIVKNNTALQGGGIYVEEPETPSSETYVHVISTTVVDNTATINAGGLWFSTNLRANSSAFWRNSASDNANVAGTFSTGLTQIVENYPLNYCGVGSLRAAGVNNIELPTVASEGVRWNSAMPYESGESEGENYFPITVSSVLGRAGMTYAAYESFRRLYPTLELTDIFGLNRMEQETAGTLTLADDSSYPKEVKNNSFIEIGARVMNGNFEVKLEYRHVMTRLFVSTTERLPTEQALNLQNNTLTNEKIHRGIDAAAWSAMSASAKKAVEDDVEMYKQMGSTFLNPFHRLGDALEYIVKVRKATDVEYEDADGNPVAKPGGEGNMSVADFYKDVRFEVFVCGGTFYPFRDAHGNQGDNRANTFLIPEEVTIVGGVNHQASGHSYCQETTGTKNVAGYDMDPATTYDIRMAREHMDRNGNHVMEPWELKEQTILDGNAVINDTKTNVYHVITCLADESQVGQLPTRYREGQTISTGDLVGFPEFVNPSNGDLLDNIEAECRESRDRRVIILDGMTIMGGYANQIDAKDEDDNFQKLTYFRGGGVLVDGTWNHLESESIDLQEVLGLPRRNVPLMMTSCLVKDNTAANGGGVYTNSTFYAFSCHFTQNLAVGPMSTRDQDHIVWTAGGAIANNYEIHLWNSLFDNNEARHGTYNINTGDPSQTEFAEARQGYGGAVSCSETGLARICNCDFVRNKAVAFPALFNFLDNNLRARSSGLPSNSPYYYGKGWHFAVNTIFWGNRATAANLPEATPFETEYYTSGEIAADARQPYHVANFGPKLDVATLTFCSYEVETGRAGTVWYSNHDHAKAAPIKPKDYGDGQGTIDGLTRLYQGRFTDVLDEYFGYYPDGSPTTPFYKLDGSGDAIPCAMDDGSIQLDVAGTPTTPTAEQKATAIPYNYNLVLESENQVPGGPYFVQPSLSAGIDGYMETADWLVARLNNSVDTGWGFLKQNVSMPDESSGLYNTTLLEVARDDSGNDINDGSGDPILVPTGTKLVLDGGGTPRTFHEYYYLDGVTKHDVSEEINITIPVGKRLSSPEFNEVKVGTYRVDDTDYDYYQRVPNLVDDPTDPRIGSHQYDKLYGEGFYNLHSKNIHERFAGIGYPNLLPMGDETYMEYSRDGEGEATNMRRISTHPKMGVQDVFIDMGIYEYQYVQLVTAGDEIDVIWVAPTENEGVVCDGSTAYKATSDLQLAIETLLLSRNDHDKMVKLKTGSYSPTKMTQSNHKAFFVSVPDKQDGVLLPKTLAGDETHVARSLTFRGGYPDTPGDAPLESYETLRDATFFPVTFIMTKDLGNTDQQLDHLFIIEDAELKGTFANYMQGKNPDFIELTMPITFDGITFVNPYGTDHEDGGSAILYREQYQTKMEGQTYTKDHNNLLKPQTIEVDEVTYKIPKLVIRDCSFVANGKETGVSAVKIKKGGGPSLIVNSLFHSNSGAPIDALNTTVVNCTFALNGGHVTLKNEREYYDYDSELGTYGSYADYTSVLHNSIIWKDDEGETDPSKKKMWDNTDIDISNTTMQYNAYTYWNTSTGDFDEPTGTTAEDARHNMLLSTENDDVILGPNFIDPVGVVPDEGTAEEKLLAQKRSRNFKLNPNAHIINKASETLYKNFVPYYAESSTTEQKTKNEQTYYFHSVQFSMPVMLTDAQLKGKNADRDYEGYTEIELGFVPRWKGLHPDRGAYECTANIQRVQYVTSSGMNDKDGSTWENAYSIDHLQQAVDVASIYYLTTEATATDNRRAYVFVGTNARLNEPLKLRDGVSVYGGVIDNLHGVEDEDYTDDNIRDYIYKMKAGRLGIATSGVGRNSIKGLVSPNTSVHESGFLLDGFWIQDATVPVDMSKDNTILMNDIITGNTMAESGQPVVNLAGGSTTGSLLYNTLLYENTAGDGAPVVNVGTNGYMLNCTVVAPDNTAVSGTMANVSNSIARDNTSTGPMFAPYLSPQNAYDTSLPTYLKDWEPYWFQLHEFSNQINAGTDDNGAGGGSTVKDGGNSIAKLFPDYVDFSYDRDILGNPRRLRNRVDNGAFETWCIEKDAAVQATNATNAAFTTNYGGHQYPHPGSVVYLHKNANLIFAVDGEGNPLFASAINPGYVLVKEGGSVYGQGNPLNFSYVAADKHIGSRYSLMSFPFDVNIEGSVAVTGTTTLTQTDKSGDITPYIYDSYSRSAYNFDYKENNSPMWKTNITSIQNAASQLKRTEGWLLDLEENTPYPDTLRFTGWGAAAGDYVYTEDGSPTKTVTLTQNDAHAVTGSGYPRFTKSEDMGWNLKGQPWLVSAYETDGTNPDFNMDVPHLFYSMNGDGSYAKALGQIYTTRSWDDGARLHLSDGFFTQTAVIDDEETLTFKMPVYGGSAPVAPARPLVALASQSSTLSRTASTNTSYLDYIELHPQDGADTEMPYRLGSDGIKWFGFEDEEPQLYVVNGAGTPLSLVSATPIETEIPLGVKAAKQGELTFTLPSPETFEEYEHVWLTDHATGEVTDLTERNYTVTNKVTGYNETRFTLRIGGKAPERVLPENNLLIYINHHRLTIKGLNEGDLISIYNVGGILFENVRAQETEYHRDLPDGIFIVRVNSTAKKVHSRP